MELFLSKVRHWKQRFDPKAEFVFRKRVRIGEGDKPFVDAGTVVDKTRFARRLRRWWDAGFIELKDWPPKAKVAPAADPKAKAAPPVVGRRKAS